MTKKIIYLLFSILVLATYSCQDQSKIYEKFIISGGRVYPGQVIKPIIYSGKYRAKVVASRPVDPSVNELRVFWNNYADSASLPIDASQNMIEILLDSMPENNYSFMLRTYDGKGNVSVRKEIFGSVYGSIYQSGLLNRILKSTNVNNEGDMIIEFDGNIIKDAVETWVTYTNTSGKDAIAKIPITESSLVISDFKGGASYATRYIPETLCIDTFSTNYTPIKVFEKVDNSL